MSSVRVLLIKTEPKNQGGREQLSSMLLDSLGVATNGKLQIFNLPPRIRPVSIADSLVGRVDGITAGVEKDLLYCVTQHSPDCVFIDGSNLGRLAQIMKNKRVNIPILTFYHNVEARFFFDAFRAHPSLHALGVLIANTIAERYATLCSNRRVMLNTRDTLMLGKIYGRLGTDILPMALRDQFKPTVVDIVRPHQKSYALFVGGAFYANVEGMAWYARKIAPFAPIETVVLGRGMEVHKSRLEKWGNVHVVGGVDDLVAWYRHATVVVAPILSGSGMKTKTAEALMHGKPVIGTPEAFVGYCTDGENNLYSCKEPKHFLQALQNAHKKSSGFYPSLRTNYEKNHSAKAMQSRLVEIVRRALQEHAE